MAKKSSSTGKLSPKVTLKAPMMMTRRLLFSRDARVLLLVGDMLESHAWDLASRKRIMSESMEDAMMDFGKLAGGLMKEADADGDEDLLADFGSLMSEAFGGKPAGKAKKNKKAVDLMNVELGGPNLSPEGQAYMRTARGPTGLEPLDLAAGLIKKPAAPFRTLSPDARFYASIDDKSRKVALWDARTAKHLTDCAGKARDTLSPLAFSRDATLLAGEIDTGTAAIWHVASGRRHLTIKGHGSNLSALEFSPDGACLATAAEDDSIGLWDAVTGELKSFLVGFASTIGSIAFASDADAPVLVAADTDSLGVFKMPDLSPVARIPRSLLGSKDDDLESVGASSDGKLVALATGGGKVLVFETADLLAAGLAVPKDKVRVEVPALGKDKQPKAGLADTAASAFQAFVKDHAARGLIRATEERFKNIFASLPKGTLHIMFELDPRMPRENADSGLYWAAQRKNAETIVAYKLDGFESALVTSDEIDEDTFRPVKGKLWELHRDAMAEFLADLFQKHAPPKLPGLLVVSFQVNRVYDLRERVWKDYADTLYPNHAARARK